MSQTWWWYWDPTYRIPDTKELNMFDIISLGFILYLLAYGLLASLFGMFLFQLYGTRIINKFGIEDLSILGYVILTILVGFNMLNYLFLNVYNSFILPGGGVVFTIVSTFLLVWGLYSLILDELIPNAIVFLGFLLYYISIIFTRIVILLIAFIIVIPTLPIVNSAENSTREFLNSTNLSNYGEYVSNQLGAVMIKSTASSMIAMLGFLLLLVGMAIPTYIYIQYLASKYSLKRYS